VSRITWRRNRRTAPRDAPFYVQERIVLCPAALDNQRQSMEQPTDWTSARLGPISAYEDLCMATPKLVSISARDAAVELNRDNFLRELIRQLSGTIQDVIGLEEASGFVSVVGQAIGDQINREYTSAMEVPALNREQVAEVLVDLKRRIQGDFYVIEQDDTKIVLGNRACPFGDKVLGRPAMCMMTSNVFGSIASENLGYAKVELQQTIANGDGQCRVVVYLKATREAEAAEGREYFQQVRSD
jgi:predicted ArsR family transcriptional regulator